jgi:3-hydroxyisobutyrate dehydrogenase-like beta-hydroxyacid dehydrogenase
MAKREHRMTAIGFVGLGQMGSRMVARLLAAGYTVTGYNRTKSKADPLIEQGMQWAESPRAVATASDVVFSMLNDPAAVRAATDGNDGIIAGLQAGKVYIDMSTVDPGLILELNKKVSATGASMLDAPVSGSKLTLEQGQLAIMVSGDVQIYEQVRPILLEIGPKVMYIGAAGQAMALKLAINISIGGQILLMAEGVLMAERYGIPREKAVEAMTSSAIASLGVQYRGPFLANMPDEAWFSIDMMQKDVVLALETARELGVAMPTTNIMHEVLSTSQKMGLGDEDFAIMIRALEEMSGS